MLLTLTPDGIHCPRGGFHIDPWNPVARAVLTHAHADHARPGHGASLAAREGEEILRLRLGADLPIDVVGWGETRRVGDVTVSLHPAGHIRGSAQVRVEADGEVWVVSGDYKRAPDPTCTPFEIVPCHTFVSEATFALPVYRWDRAPEVIDEILAWWNANRAAQRTSVLFCYALGKAQRLLALLAQVTDREVWIHGALDELVACYRASGVDMLTARRVPTGAAPKGTFADALVLAPPSARGSTWMRRFPQRSEAMVSGWMRVRGERRRGSFDRGFALSDHADWPGLLATVGETGAQRVVTTHGFAEPLARYLAEQGLETMVWPAFRDAAGTTGEDEA